MQLYLNLPIRAGMVLVLVDETNVYKQQQATRKRFFPLEGIDVPEKIGKRFLKEKIRTDGDGNRVPFLTEEPFSGDWPVAVEPQRMPKRRKRAGELRPQGDPNPSSTHVGRRLPANMARKQTSEVTEADYDTNVKSDDGDDRFTRLPERNDVAAGRKLKSLADQNFSEMKPGMVGMAVKALGFKLVDGLDIGARQAALETMCEIVVQEIEIP